MQSLELETAGAQTATNPEALKPVTTSARPSCTESCSSRTSLREILRVSCTAFEHMVAVLGTRFGLMRVQKHKLAVI